MGRGTIASEAAAPARSMAAGRGARGVEDSTRSSRSWRSLKNSVGRSAWLATMTASTRLQRGQAISSYVPKPIDISRIELPPELGALIEQLAENNHDIWAEQRLHDGWTLGPTRDDAKKQRPLLVPYRDLPASEKNYDRRMAIGTLKALLAAGYEIRRR